MSGLVNDPTLRMLAERSRQARKDAEEQQQTSSSQYGELSDRLYFLLLKNVSRDSPLSPEEIEVSLPSYRCDPFQ